MSATENATRLQRPAQLDELLRVDRHLKTSAMQAKPEPPSLGALSRYYRFIHPNMDSEENKAALEKNLWVNFWLG